MEPASRPRRLARWAARALLLALRVLIVGLAMGMAPPSRVETLLRHEDAVAQVEEDDLP